MAYATGSSAALNHPLSPRGIPSAAGHPPSSTPHAAHTPQQPPQLPQQPRPSINNSFPPHARSKLGRLMILV